ncbi:MAG: amidase family protein [Gammaproteobacteria bacterium]|nr:amidase family protein [Gammaproteobacteria bacterium]
MRGLECCIGDGRHRLASADIAELQALLSAGEITSTALVRRCLARIDAFDVAGPKLNAMIYVNPNALAEAQRMDAARAADAVRGPLHGIPLVIKDNYDTHDMPTTAGSVALKGHRPSADAFQVKRDGTARDQCAGRLHRRRAAGGRRAIRT